MKDSPSEWKLLETKKSGRIYNLHSYWTKQPIEVVEKFVLHFTKEKDTVLDCFAGTGMTGVAAKKNKRKAILFDISPICCEISKGYTTKINNYKKIMDEFKKFEEFFETRFKDIINYKIGNEYKRIKYILYSREYECPKCQTLFDTFLAETDFLRQNTKTPGDKCPKCGFSDYTKYIPNEIRIREVTLESHPEKMRIKPSKEYTEIISQIPDIKYPTANFFGREPKRNYKYNIRQVYQLYSRPNRYLLYEILQYINRIEDEEVRRIFRFSFSSILFNCSLLSAYTKYENTVYRTGTYYIPRIIKDNNPLDSFYSKFNMICNTLNEIYEEDCAVRIFNQSATEMHNLDANSIDYIYIDPPYSDVINYSELNIVWESWLGLKTDNSNEIIVNKEHGKEESFYERKMDDVFSELSRVLRPNGILTLIFHHPKPRHWRIIQNVMTKNNFSLINEYPIQIRSASKTHSQINTTKPVQGFLALNFNKATKNINLKSLTPVEYEKIINNLKQQANKNGYSSKSDVYDYLITKLFPEYTIENFTI